MKFQNPFVYLSSKKAVSGSVFCDRSVCKAVVAGLVCLVVGVFLGAMFGDRLINRGVPVKVSKVAEINRLLQKVSRHMAIVKDEDPIVATVQNAEILRQTNPFFYRDVQNGDLLIVWESNGRAILYSTKKDIVLSALVLPPGAFSAQDLTGAVGAGSGGAVDAKQLNIEIRNASGRSGAAKDLSDKFKAAGFSQVIVSNSAKTYPTTTLVKVSDKAKSEASLDQIITLSGGAFGSLPSGEASGSADLLIILGAQ